jgi:hypothetical protein
MAGTAMQAKEIAERSERTVYSLRNLSGVSLCSGYIGIKYWEDQKVTFSVGELGKYLEGCRKLGSSSCKNIRHC